VSSGFADLDVPALKLSGTYTLAVEGTVDSSAPSNYSFAVRPPSGIRSPRSRPRHSSLL
jgi:hypothetical protein